MTEKDKVVHKTELGKWLKNTYGPVCIWLLHFQRSNGNRKFELEEIRKIIRLNFIIVTLKNVNLRVFDVT